MKNYDEETKEAVLARMHETLNAWRERGHKTERRQARRAKEATRNEWAQPSHGDVVRALS